MNKNLLRKLEMLSPPPRELINQYKRRDVFRCSHESHLHFKSAVSVFHVIKEKKCYPGKPGSYFISSFYCGLDSCVPDCICWYNLSIGGTHVKHVARRNEKLNSGRIRQLILEMGLSLAYDTYNDYAEVFKDKLWMLTALNATITL